MSNSLFSHSDGYLNVTESDFVPYGNADYSLLWTFCTSLNLLTE